MATEDFSERELDEAEKQLRRLAEDPRFISGIYNYCDRWCERCPMTSRCMLFAQENSRRKGRGKLDADNEEFWRQVALQFAVAQRMILRDAKERGIDLTADDPEVDREMRTHKRRRAQLRNLDVSKMAHRYGQSVNEWFEAHNGQFEQKQGELESKLLMQLDGDNPEADARQIIDAVEIVRWYQYQIEVKLSRALSGAARARRVDVEQRPWVQSDADGSGKVALIGVDRSLAAWSQLRERLPDEQDRILDLLLHLDRLRKAIETALPGARQFKRPGFD